MISQNMADILSAVSGVTLLALGVAIIINFNIRTAIISKKIGEACREEGVSWKFWSDSETMMCFAISPELLIKSGDSAKIIELKQMLVSHRRSIWRSLLCSFSLMIASFVSVVGIQIIASR